MKFHILKSEIESALSLASQCVVPNSTTPLSEYVKITISGPNLVVEANNELSSIRTRATLDIAVENSLSFCVHCKDLENIVRAIGDDTITLYIGEKEAVILHTSGEFRIPIVSSDDFVSGSFPDDEKANKYELSTSLFRKWLSYAKNFTENNETVPATSCMYLYTEQNGVVGFCATDRSTLITEEYKDENVTADSAVLISNKTFSALANIFKNDDTVKVKVNSEDCIICLSTSKVKLTCRTLKAKYPAFKKLFEASVPTKVTFNRRALTEALKRIDICTSDSYNKTAITLNGDQAVLSLVNLISGKSATETVPYTGECDNTKLTFFVNHLLRTMGSLTTEELEIHFGATNKPVIIRETGDGATESKGIMICPTV